MEYKNCLNCDTALEGKFCKNCGQKAHTHRITTRHFLLHDLLHGVWHVDKGILYTLKQIFTRPGLAAVDYIQGKRIRFYNVFYLTLIMLGLNIVAIHLAQKHPRIDLEATGDGEQIVNFIRTNIKIIILSVIPFFALASKILFKRLYFNYAEHVVIAGFALLGSTTIALVINTIALIPGLATATLGSILFSLLEICCLLFPVWVYYLATRAYYKRAGFLWRIVSFYTIFIIATFLTFFLIILLVNGGTFEGSILI